ncbi:hypothetical protein GP486_004505 [Trichoglossum hirsutum]|uniref:ABC transporter n=1 Tax=Trichoglossum hirsutum TaxID=265104 RepID=A0A9P8LAV4_9PEZI|nr:hypothetical protein GP486_004505 [Trichoglossum hirsutum]
MVTSERSSIFIGAVGFVFVVAATHPAVKLLTTAAIGRPKTLYGDELLYEDEDGVATEQTASAYTDRVPKTILYLASIVGFLTSLGLSVFASLRPEKSLLIESWLTALCWSFLLLQAAAVSLERRSVNRFDLGIYSAISCFSLAAAICLENWLLTRTYGEDPIHFLFTSSQAITAIVALCACVSLPRRPDVFRDGYAVDRQYTVSAISRYSFAWCGPLLNIAGLGRRLEIEDLPALDSLTSSNNLQQRFHAMQKRGKLWKLVFWSHATVFVRQWLLTLLGSVMNFAPQLCMYHILQLLEKRQLGNSIAAEAWWWVVGLGLAQVAQAWVEAWLFWVCWCHICLPVRSQLSALIFQKTMKKKDVRGSHGAEKGGANRDIPEVVRESGRGGEESEPGDENEAQRSRQGAINLIGIDTKRVADFTCYNYYFLQTVANFVISIAFLVKLIGVRSLLAGLTVTVLSMPLNVYFAKRYSDAQDNLMKERDRKMAVVTEALRGIRQIKLMGAEGNWLARIRGVRERELGQQWNVFLADTALLFCWIAGPVMLAAVSLAVYSILHGSLSASIAFTTVSVFNRIEITLTIIPELTTVISGKTGSGKSLLLASILGEADLLSGTIRVPRAPPVHERYDHKATKDNWIIPSSIAFVGQTPWIENATMKDNILFGLPYDPVRYQKVIKACALEKDVEMLIDGEVTEIGANGINLSGGQRWRMSFARALYSRAGILILDDIFSAVDAHVGKLIFEEGLTGELAKGRTRILVTHHVSLCLPRTEYAILLGDGSVEHAGAVVDLQRSGSLAEIYNHEQDSTTDKPDERSPESSIPPGLGDDSYERPEHVDAAINGNNTPRTSEREAEDKKPTTPRKFVEDEKRETGKIKWEIYREYLKSSGSVWFWVMAVLAFVGYQSMLVGRSWWVKVWTGSHKTETVTAHHGSYYYVQKKTSSIQSADGLWYYLGIYVGLSVFLSIVGVLKYWWIFRGCIRASRKLFDELAYAVVRAPLRWLDTVPLGRVLNRFTSDFNIIDSQMATDVSYLAYNILQVVGVVMAGSLVSPYMILIAALLLGICLHYAQRYLPGAREIKRLESNAKSPVFELFGTSLTGVGTIRAFGKEDEYVNRMFSRIDDHARALWHLWLFNRWMGFRMAMVGAIFAVLVAGVIVSIKKIDASLAGFAIIFALDFTQSVIWMIRRYANIELDMNSCERVIEYSKEIRIEDQSGLDAPAAWPQEGRLSVDDLVVGYAPDLPPVLKGLSFSVERNQRVGVVGRTGAGKSSLTLALFRFLEAREGSVYIDGLDISKLKLHDLRSRLAIIPQDPVLFSGTVRSNLDAFDDHTDAELREALERVHLVNTTLRDDYTSSSDNNINMFEDLSSRISEGGQNLSQGQRQLLCIARAIVSRPKIMVLDEATSAVDMATDALIQRSIREEFKDSTLLVIAHRLSTIADFDKILVMSDGRAIEYGAPRNLFEARGEFWKMVIQSGERAWVEELVLGGHD